MEKIEQSQIEAWKEKHGSVYQISVGNHVGYLKGVDRKIMNAAWAAQKQSKNHTAFHEVILKNCWLGGDQDIIEADNSILSVVIEGVLDDLVELQQVSLKKL